MARHTFPSVPVGEVTRVLPGAVLSGPAVGITGITQDSRQVGPGDLYCCVRGDTHDGHEFAPDAVARGAVALLVDRDIDVPDGQVAVIRVADVRSCLGVVAATLSGNPSRALTVVGVTGTNGKTSTTAMIAAILSAAGHRVATIGTLTQARTTPEAIDLQAMLAGFVEQSVTHVVMEVSSHALAMHRVAGTVFDTAVFTNLGRDHLDFHGTQEAYFAAKAALFTPALALRGVVNLDDTHGRLLHDAAPVPMTGFSRDDARDVRVGIDMCEFVWRGTQVRVPQGGAFTVMNAIAAATVAEVLGIAPSTIAEGLSGLPKVAGRFESVPNDRGIGVVVDYAHTAEGIEQVLASARALTTGRVFIVFGCGGDRDQGKRPLMGRAAARSADVVIVTSDNPRTEDPVRIIDEVVAGIEAGSRASVQREPDRRRAIASAISQAGHGDIVVLAGKGHESTQEVDGVFHPFADVEAAREALGQEGGAPG